MKNKRKKLIKKIILSVVGFIFSIIVSVPFLYMLFASIQPSKYDIINGYFFPRALDFKNYIEAIDYIDFFSLLSNTITIVVFNLVFSIFSTVLVAYGFARFKGKNRKLLFYIMLSTMMLPWVVTLVPSYVIFDKLGWTNSFLPLIIPALGSNAYFVFMLRQFMITIPKELDEAAKIDGASSFRILISIIVPNIKPALATMLIMQFISLWSDYIGPSLYLNSPSLHTLAVGLQYFKPSSGGSIPWDLVMASCVMFSLPMIIIMTTCQNAYTRGIVSSGVKG